MKVFKRMKYYKLNFWDYIVFVKNSEEEKAVKTCKDGAVRVTVKQVDEILYNHKLHYITNWRETRDSHYFSPHSFFDTLFYLADEETRNKMKKIQDRDDPSWIPKIRPLVKFF
jgi:hypothetical protein